MVFQKIPFSGRENGAIGHQEISSNVGIRDDDEELGAHPDGEEGSIFFRPIVYCQLRILSKKGITNGRPWGQGISTLITYPLAKKYRSQEIDGCSCHYPNKDILNWRDIKLESVA